MTRTVIHVGESHVRSFTLKVGVVAKCTVSLSLDNAAAAAGRMVGLCDGSNAN